MRYFIIFGVLIAFGFSFCKKDKKTEPVATASSATPNPTTPTNPTITVKPTKNMYVSNELKQWGYFQVGSYWIMQDSITGTLDSIYVHQVTTQNVLYVMPGDTDVIGEQITIHLNEIAENLILTPFKKIQRFGGANGNMTCLDIGYTNSANYNITNFTVLNNTFDTVRCFQFSHEFPNHNTHTTFTYNETAYWKKNIGYAKRRLGTGTNHVKMLLRYNVIQ